MPPIGCRPALDERIVGASPHCSLEPSVATIHQSWLERSMPWWMCIPISTDACRPCALIWKVGCRKAGTDPPRRLSPFDWNHPDRAAPRHRGCNALSANPIGHLRSVRQEMDGYNPYRAISLASPPSAGNPRYTPPPSRFDRNTIRLPSGHRNRGIPLPAPSNVKRIGLSLPQSVFDIEIQFSHPETSIAHHAGSELRIRHQPAYPGTVLRHPTSLHRPGSQPASTMAGERRNRKTSMPRQAQPCSTWRRMQATIESPDGALRARTLRSSGRQNEQCRSLRPRVPIKSYPRPVSMDCTCSAELADARPVPLRRPAHHWSPRRFLLHRKLHRLLRTARSIRPAHLPGRALRRRPDSRASDRLNVLWTAIVSIRALRRTEMLRVRLLSSTKLSGQTVRINSSFPTNRPACRISTSSVSKTFGSRGTGSPSRSNRCSAGSRRSIQT